MNGEERPSVIRKSADLVKDEWASLIEKRGKISEAVVLEVTNGCSAGECSHCYLFAKKGGGEEMSSDLAFSILNGLSQAENKPAEIWITGGEPGIYPSLPEVAERASGLGFSVLVVTNGEPFEKMDLIEKVAPFVDGMAVTLRSFSPFAHQLMMGGIPSDLLEEAKKHWQRNPFDPPEEMVQEMKTAGVSIERFFTIDHHGRSMQALRNLQEYNEAVLREGGKAVRIELNHDVFNCRADEGGHGELYRMLRGLKREEGIEIDNVYLQILSVSGRAIESLEDQLPQIAWLTPSTETIIAYLKDQKDCIKERLIKGETVWVDPIPQAILNQLEAQGIGTKEIPGYQPEATPAFDVKGNLRDNVLYLA